MKVDAFMRFEGTILEKITMFAYNCNDRFKKEKTKGGCIEKTICAFYEKRAGAENRPYCLRPACIL